MRFVDTNIPLYAVSPHAEDDAKRRVSRELLSHNEGQLALSVQVLGEFYFQVTRPTRSGALTHNEAVTVIRDLKRHHVPPLTLETFEQAMEYRERLSLSYWDCLILAAPKQIGCDAVYSEDMNSSQDYDGLRVINPFEEASVPGPA